mmetsp:Transcript_18/g.35  ORF Transcript_18/g.35 Transcript_18/m.35 type:complete len:480 (+) Transcript_18:137-1576(+)
MLCCLDSFSDPKDSYNRQTFGGVSDFPGQRRFVKTGGNALAEAPPNRERISVTVPNGVSPGQAIQVSAPDGKIVSAVVPSGMVPGSSFMVEVPGQSTPLENSHGPNSSITSISSPTTEPGVQILPPPVASSATQSLDQFSSLTADKLVMVHVPPGVSPGTTLHVQVPGENRTIAAVVPPGVTQFHVKCPPRTGHAPVPVPPPAVVATPLPIPVPPPTTSSAEDVPFSMALDVPPPSNANYPSRSVSATSNNYSGQKVSAIQSGQSMLKVQVPPGTAPGSTIHVQVPGENRMVAAQVPFGVSEFHVAYDPANNSSNTIPPVQRSFSPAAAPGEQLILVKVPPGAAPGTNLHVQVPNEPGRVLSAVVPPNVTEFHVSYRPQNDGRGQSTPSTNRNNNGGYMNNNNNCGYQNNNGKRTNGGGGFGTTAMSMLGGAAMGAVAMSMFDHAHHSSANSGYENTYDDFDTDDFGGDFDGGGFDGDF